MKISVDSPFPGVWCAQDEDTIDCDIVDGTHHYSGMRATAATRRGALTDLRDQYVDILEDFEREFRDEDAAHLAIAAIDKLLEQGTD